MKKQIFVAGLALLSSFMVAFATSTQGQMKQTSPQINGLYVFGDSLSDVGNVFQASGKAYPPNPPYFQGRYSNGSVWVEYLASKLTLTAQENTNLAYGGATTGSLNTNGIPGLLTQVQGFTKSNQKANPNALYVVWAGANDYLYGSANPAVSVENISTAVQSLSKAGAKKILVANVPDLGKLPATRNGANSASLSALATAHNSSLAKSVDLLNQKLGSETQIIILDVFSLYQEAIKNPEKFGLNNVTTACLSNLGVCENPDKFLFWDGIHPTTSAHGILAEAALRALSVPK